MEKAWTRWSTTVVSIAVAGMLGVGAMNYLVDPYEIFGTSKLRPGVCDGSTQNNVRRDGLPFHAEA